MIKKYRQEPHYINGLDLTIQKRIEALKAERQEILKCGLRDSKRLNDIHALIDDLMSELYFKRGEK